MIFTETKLGGVYIIELEKNEDERGVFARSFCQNEFRAFGLKTEIAQCNFSQNKPQGTLRGMHYQVRPHEEAKLVSCFMGSMFDVIIDLRQDSPTFMDWLGVELSAENNKMLYVPEGLAHGFQTLTTNAVVYYQMFEFYHPESARGVRFNDRAFGVKWPLECSVISKKDLSYPDFKKKRINNTGAKFKQ
jgi:dTDP-4-dehydrorhamnose 3,5-epimerase